MEIEDNITRADEVQDIFDQMPSWLIRYGTLLMFIVIGLIILAGFLIKYPDTLDGKILITSNNPPIPLIAERNGIVKFQLKDSSYVKKGDFISYIENPTSFESWKKANKIVLKYDSSYSYKSLRSLPLIEELGELQSEYNYFRYNYQELKRYLVFNNDSFEQESLQEQLSQNIRYKKNLEKKHELLLREVQLSEDRYQSDKLLNKRNTLSSLQLENSEEKLLIVKNRLLELRSNQILCEEKMVILKRNIKDISRGKKSTLAQLEGKFQSSLLVLKSRMNLFEKSYLQVSPCDGFVTYYEIYDNNHYVSIGDNIAFVSGATNEIKGQLKLKGNGFGKVKKDQVVKIYLDSYSAAKFGVIYGKVGSISEVNVDNIYSLIIELPEGLLTSYGHKLRFMPDLNGVGSVITKNVSIIERIIEKITSVVQ